MRTQTRLFLRALAVALVFHATGCDRSSDSPPSLVINEVMARNVDFPFTDANGLHVDWAEIYNPNDAPISLGGYTLSDNPGRPRKYRFPANLTIPGRGFLVVFLIGGGEMEEATASGMALEVTALHADFGVSAEEDTLLLYAMDGDRLVDRAGIRMLPADASNGRYPDGSANYGTMYAPSPGEPNHPLGVEPARWGDRPNSPCDAEEGEVVEIRFSVEQDFEMGPPDVFLRYAIQTEGCDVQADPGSLDFTEASVLLFSEEEFVETCEPAVVEGEEDNCHRDVYGTPVLTLQKRRLSYQGFLPHQDCETTILWELEVDDGLGLTPLLHRECYTYCEDCVTLVVNEHMPSNTGIYFSRERLSPTTGLPEIHPDTPDWIEIHNFGDQDIDIRDYALIGRGDFESGDLFSWTFGGALQGRWGGKITTIPAGGYVVVLADQDRGGAIRTYFLSDANGNPLEEGEFFAVADMGGNPVGERAREFYSTRFANQADRAAPDEFSLIAPTGRRIDHVVLDFSANPPEFGGPGDLKENLAVGQFPPEGTPPQPNALQPGTVTLCPTPGRKNTDPESCQLDLLPRFEELLLVEPRCPGPGKAVQVAAWISIDEDTGDDFEVELLYDAGPEGVEGGLPCDEDGALRATVSRDLAPPEEQRRAPPGAVLYRIDAQIPGQPEGTVVRSCLRAQDLQLQSPGDWIVLDEATSPQVSFRFRAGPPLAAAGVVLNEILPRNGSTLLPGFDASYLPDYLEMRYAADAPEPVLDLSGYYLTQEALPEDPIRRARLWPFPEGTTIARGEHLLLVFSPLPGEPVVEDLPDKFAGYQYVDSFDPDSCRETIYLITPDSLGNCVVDRLTWDFRNGDLGTCEGAQDGDEAWGRVSCLGREEPDVLSRPTPGEPNVLPPILFGVAHVGGVDHAPNPCVDPRGIVKLQASFFADGLIAALIGAGDDDMLFPVRNFSVSHGSLFGTSPRLVQTAPATDPPPGYRLLFLEQEMGAPAEVPADGVVRFGFSVEDSCGGVVDPCAGKLCYSFGMATPDRQMPGIRINEINRSSFLPWEGERTDPRSWVELCNTSNEPVDLDGMSLSNDAANPRLAPLPAGIRLERGETLLVLTEGEPPVHGDGIPRQVLLPLNWAKLLHCAVGVRCRLSGTISLYDSPERGNCLLDSFEFQFAGSQQGECQNPCNDSALGRIPDGTGNIRELDQPSPGTLNGFVRGDADGDLDVNLSDAVLILQFLFQGQKPPLCYDVLDSDDDGSVTVTDAVFLLRFLFSGGDSPRPPFPEPGIDPTPDDLPCKPG